MRRQILENVVSLREILTEGLNDAQIQAVTHGEGPALILAGPGSGKTVTIVKRILYLIQIKHISPEEILVVTFTKDAALSMQRRFAEQTESMCGQTAQDGYPMRQTYAVNFGTFHSVFYQILRMSGACKDHAIPTLTQKRNILMSVLKYSSNGEDLKAQADQYLAAIGYYKNTQNAERAKRLLSAGEREGFSAVLDAYQRKCRESGLLDFDDMVYECLRLLKKDAVLLASLRRRFRYLLVDEFQDINPVQYEVMKLLGAEHRNLFVVGDEDQSIYGFRGSAPECVRRFKEEFGAMQILLNANYRSTAQIVETADRVIAENKNRLLADKNSYAAGPNRGIKESVRMLTFETRAEEMRYLAEKLEEFHHTAENREERVQVEQKERTELERTEREQTESAQTIKRETCAVLFRTNSGMKNLAVLLNKAGIPFAMKEKTDDPYEHFIVKDIMAYLKLAAGAGNREDFLRIMNRPARGISRELAMKADVGKIPEHGEAVGREGAALRELQVHLDRMRTMPLALAIRYICKAVGYEEYLKHRKEAGEQLEEWLDILDFCKEDAGSYQSLREWEEAQKKLRSGMQASGSDTRSDVRADARSDADPPCIHLMTAHGSKGLEFDRVYLPDCNEKVYPHGNMQDAETVEEERRIFYVAMTRAKKDLELLGVTGTRERPRLLTRFLNPVIHQLTHQTHSYPNIRQKRP